uniref:5-hydroxytryptamine receptor 3C n=1 Tax=Sus scrofa TaxID=9823 RepID=A0A8D1P603_PIG
MEGGWPLVWGGGGVGFPLCLTVSLLLRGKMGHFTINCSGFDQHRVDAAVFQAIFNQKAFCPLINYSIPTHVNISFTLSAISELWVSAITISLWTNLWLPHIIIMKSWVSGTDVDQTPDGLSVCVTNDSCVVYNTPMWVTSICSLDIFYFPFDQQNCTLTFSSFLYTDDLYPLLENMLLGMDKEILGISKTTPKMAVGSNLFDQIMFYVRRRPTLYVINLLVPSSFLMAIDALSFYLPAESENRAPFKITLLLGYNVFLLMMNDLLPISGTPLISVYFALCLSLMVVSLLETIFITYLLHLAATQPPPLPRLLHSLLLHAPAQGNKEPRELGGKELGPREELNRDSGLTKAQLVDLWVQCNHMMDSLHFRLYLLFLAPPSPRSSSSGTSRSRVLMVQEH